METRKVSEYVVEQLCQWGVRRVYGVAGDAVLPLLDALGRQTSIKYVGCRHEAAAAMMASAEAKLTRRPGVCLATSGPGAVNLLNGLADAQVDRVPVVAITGQVESGRIGTGTKQYVDQQELIAPLSRYSALVANPQAVQEVLAHAFAAAVSGNGVGHVSFCRDVWDKTTDFPVLTRVPRRAAVLADRTEVREAGDRLEQARRPLVLMGTGARPVAGYVTQLAERLGAGIVLSLGAKGAVPESHPLVLGGLGDGGSRATLQALAEADLLVVLGAAWFPRSFIPEGLPVVQVDAEPSSFHAHEPLFSVTGPLEEVLPLWVKRFEWHNPASSKWMHRVEVLHDAFMREWDGDWAVQEESEPGIRPEVLMRTLETVVAPDAVVALDTGEHTLWFNRAFRAIRQVPLFSGKWRTMGFALPAAIAAALVHPRRQVVAIVGDGGLTMQAGELLTAAEQQVPITVIVVNNGTLGLEEAKMRAEGYQPFGTRLTNPDFAGLALACGWEAERIDQVSSLADALRNALSGSRPTLVEVIATPPTYTPIRQQFLLQTEA